MAIAGALVVPAKKETTSELVGRLKKISGVEVETTGPNGIAIVLEAENSKSLKDLSTDIEKWDEVVNFQLAYLNWEEIDGEK